MVVLEGIVIFILAACVFWNIGLPIILDIIWIKRVKSGKSEKFGPLGIISIIVTVFGLVSLPRLFTMIGEWFGWI
ncbi:MAG: hypothetical protein IK111_11825 [Lachnospiraceae bacterium]|nr:hypothetical protein [Lachnospiraceae bacterium]